MFYKYKNKSMNQRILIAGDASAEAVTTLVSMAIQGEEANTGIHMLCAREENPV